jgi:dipeptidyl aminopeptidase/acylaminoacyl peptidase
MRVPVLQFLGAKDLRVPYRQGLLFDAMTRKQGGEIMTYVYENSGHSLGDSVDTVVDVIVKSLLFLEGGLKEE